MTHAAKVDLVIDPRQAPYSNNRRRVPRVPSEPDRLPRHPVGHGSRHKYAAKEAWHFGWESEVHILAEDGAEARGMEVGNRAKQRQQMQLGAPKSAPFLALALLLLPWLLDCQPPKVKLAWTAHSTGRLSPSRGSAPSRAPLPLLRDG